MNSFFKFILYFLMISIGLLAMYSILNAGNPKSFLREFVPNPRHDVYVALGTSLLVFILGFFVFYGRDREGFQQIIQLNDGKIRSLRKKGISDDEIAESILSAMGGRGGYRYKMAKKKLVVYLSSFT